MLMHDIENVINKEIGLLDDLLIKIGRNVKSFIERSDIKGFENYFGEEAYKNYLSPHDLKNNSARLKMDTSNKERCQVLNAFLTTVFMQAAYYYACYKGNLNAVQYLIETQHMTDVSEQVDHSFLIYVKDPDTEIKGRPISLAVQSGNLGLVRYLYEKTSAMMETCIGQTTETTPLMIASSQGQIEMIEFLLAQGANPNGAKAASPKTPLFFAIQTKNAQVIRLLVSADAIVTHQEVIMAIRLGLSLEIIEFLLDHTVEKEDPYNPYLIAAIQSGHVALLTALEARPNVTPFVELSRFDEMPIEKRMLIAAAQSANLNMLKHLQESKAIDIKKWVSEENQQLAMQLSPEKGAPMPSGGIFDLYGKDTILYAAIQSDNAQKRLVLLPYLFEELGLCPSDAVLKKLSSSYLSLKTTAYLYRIITEYSALKEALSVIAKEVNPQNLCALFVLYNTPFIQNSRNNFQCELASLIKTRLGAAHAYDLIPLLKNNKEAFIGALFYYCTIDSGKPEGELRVLLRFAHLYAIIDTVDTQNCQGDTLALYAARHANYAVAHLLLKLSANPDIPNHKGETLINLSLGTPYTDTFEWIKTYANQVTHSIRYASKGPWGIGEELKELLLLTGGNTHGVPLAELVENSIRSEHKLKVLFIHLSEAHARQMVRLFHDPAFIKKNKIPDYTIRYIMDSFKNIAADRLAPEMVLSRLSIEKSHPPYPFFLQHLGMKPKKLTPEKVANALWLADKDVNTTRSSKSQFGLWAKAQALPFNEHEVEACLSVYVMKK